MVGLRLICAFTGTTIWFIAGDPWRIDNIYIGVVIPVGAMLAERLFRNGVVSEEPGAVPG